MSRVLVVGPYPPTTDEAAERTLALVRTLADAGDDVEVLAPHAGAAHHHADLQGLVGALAMARRTAPHDRVELLLEPSLFNRAWVSRPRRVLDRLALGAALRRWPEVEVRVDVERFPGATGAFPSRFLWQAVDRFVVPSERDRAELRGVGSVPDERIAVAEDDRAVREPSDVGWRFDGAPSRDEIMVAVRARAAEERARLLALDASAVITGAVSDDEYESWLRRATVAVQLRASTNGESSAAVADCLAAGLPTVVTRLGAARELPDGATVKVAPDVSPEGLAAEIGGLLADGARREAMAQAAVAHAEAHGFDAAAAALAAALLAPRRG